MFYILLWFNDQKVQAINDMKKEKMEKFTLDKKQ